MSPLGRAGWAVVPAVLAAAVAGGWAARRVPAGVNPHPVRLVRPARAPLSVMAQIGRDLFSDPALSPSGALSCASCHSPAHAYGPPEHPPAPGARAIPSLRYVDRIPSFGIGPDAPEQDGPTVGPVPRAGAGNAAPAAGSATSAVALVPRGGLFWDGRAATLQGQAMGPLFNPREMANRDTAALESRLAARYGARLREVFGEEVLRDRRLLLDEAVFAITRFEIEDPSFHPYNSKYDAYLEGRARLTRAEARGLALFDDPARGNCASCHLDRPGPGGRPPVFSDYEYEALGVTPDDPDQGLCGPLRTDLAGRRDLCGMFRTPSLRNAATRTAFFHDARIRTLAGAVAAYAVPAVRRAAQVGRLSQGDRADIVAFLKTLTDGYF